jgi:hypothetical protein
MPIREGHQLFRAAGFAQFEVTIMLNLKSSKIQVLGLVLAVSVQTFVSAPCLAEQSADATVSTAKVETTERIAMKPPVVSIQKTEQPQASDPALERRLRKEVASYVADMPLSAY